MKRVHVLLVAAIAAALLSVAGCASAPAPAPTTAPAKPAEPTKAAAPAAPTKAAALAEPTKAPAAPAQPTAAPAKKVDFPQKGKSVKVIVPVGAGGNNDLGARIIAAGLEKELGVPFEVVNRPGGGNAVGMQELATSKPDGYTFGVVPLPSVLGSYLDPEIKALYTRKEFAPLGRGFYSPAVLIVRPDGPYKTAKDFIDAGKANPGKITVSVANRMGSFHMGWIDLQAKTGTDFALVFFESGKAGETALLGGHVEASMNLPPEVLAEFKSGAVRVLGVWDDRESVHFPGVKTMESQGYKVYLSSHTGMAVPAGTPRELIQVLSEGAKKVLATEDVQKRFRDLGSQAAYLDPDQFGKMWEDMENLYGPILKKERESGKK